jgi:hypothetical protein
MGQRVYEVIFKYLLIVLPNDVYVLVSDECTLKTINVPKKNICILLILRFSIWFYHLVLKPICIHESYFSERGKCDVC